MPLAETVAIVGKVFSCVKPVLSCVVDPVLSCVTPYLKPLQYRVLPYEIVVGKLTKNVNKLRKVRNSVQQNVKEEENRNERAIDDCVINWLREAEDIIYEYDDFWEDEDRPNAECFKGNLPKLAMRSRLAIRSRVSGKANNIASRVDGLLQTIEDDDFSHWLRPPSFGADFDNLRYEMFASRNQTMNGIMAALADSNAGMIGVYGLSGVGKTSLIKEVAKKVKRKGKLFDVVIMVNVTSRPDISSIQGQIADKLGMKLQDESQSGRAAQLREKFKDMKEKALIILDNMGVKLDFNLLGIPSENNDDSQKNHEMKNPSANHNYAMRTEEYDASSLKKIQEEPVAKCKILMISHSEQLLLSQMDGNEIPTFCVKELTDKEAETMFKTLTEIDDENHIYKTLAAQISRKCKGLPLTVVTTAMALKKKRLPVWEDVNQKLESQNLTETPEVSAKLSYELLENEELKHIFLLCARMGHDALITDLVRYCIGLGLLQGIYTVREARDRVHALVAKLKELSLLSDSFSSDRFTMQDIIRDAALSIASQQMHALALTKEKLDEWPDMDKLERYTAISLHHCDITDIMKEFPESINCSRLRVFHLDNKDPLLEIPDNFFSGMKELRVLVLIGIHLSSLPSSIKCLKKLRMLCLEQCKLGMNLSIIGELEKLRVLSLSGSDITCLPVELRQLAKLQIFDISNCFKLEEIPAKLLSSLSSLEQLSVRNSPIQWVDEGQGKTSLSELTQLNQLTALDIRIPKITDFPKNLFFDKLDSYRIVIGDFNAYPMWDFKMLEICDASRYLALQLENGFDIDYQQEIKILFERVENLLLGQLNDVEDIFYELNYEGFPYLKYLSIVSNSKVKSIINSENQKHLEKAFPKLESLFLYEVHNMEHICHSQLTNDSFCKLKIIKIRICGQLKNVFFSSMIKHLSALETIEVSECYSLKEIVTSERDTIDEIRFPELRSLTLQSLSEFLGFYTNDASTGEQVPNRKPDELFDEKVVISKLERMVLSSIKIKKIWNDQPLTRSYFQNLIHMDVNDCWNLRYLLSLSMSKNLVNLQSLFVSECGMMESIFIETEDSMIEEERIFPKLKTINLRSMKRLRHIWRRKFPLHSFGKLDSLIIDGCNRLENVFPSYMVGRFRSLCNLKVTNCKSMKEIFDLKDCGKLDPKDMMTSLQNVHVEALLKLEHVWNNDPEGILNFKNIKKVRVQECLNLKHIFRVSIAMGLENLEYLEVWNCGQLKEIVFSGETINDNTVSFEFPKLTTARFLKLPNLESFYGGTHELRCSTLNNISVEHCHKFNLFGTETENPEIKPVFLPEKVIYNLKSMQIEPRDAKPLKRYMGNYRMHKLEELQLSRLEDTEVLYFFLHRNPNLKSLSLSNCFFEQLEPPTSLVNENSGVVPKLKSLKLMNLPSLEKIGFEGYTVLFRMLECLILKECPCLNSIALPSVSFTYLIHLEVSNCKNLMHLMTPSTAKSLVQLSTMKVIQCESMQTIVSEPENDERIIFRQLKEIELEALHSLISFCSSSRCVFDFPLLEKFVVLACGEMKKFCDDFCSTPVLQDICVRHGEEEKRAYWNGDLNVTIQHMYKNWVTDKDNMEASNPLEAFQSSRLKTLKLRNCSAEKLVNLNAVFTSLKNLEELEVSSSTNAKVIFGAEMKGYTFPLKKLTLRELPNLKHVWCEDCEGILGFQNLQEVSVTECEKLKTLFPVELAKKIVRLKKLEISRCPRFVKIVEGENATTEATEEFLFPHLTSLNLCMLPQLDCFYSGSFNLECPDLNHLELLSSGNLETFQSQQEAQASTSVNRLPLFSERKAVFILESMKLDWKNTMMLCNGKFPEDMLHKLVELELDFYDVNEVTKIPIGLLEKAFNLENLQISRCSGLEELFPFQPEQGEIRMHGHLTPSVHSAVSFSNLKQLSINDCHELKHLFTSSTAIKLVHLEEMYIVRCELMEVIIVSEEVEETSTSEAIKFERLNKIVLDSLSSLLCFCSGQDTLCLSSLITVLVWNCPKLEVFSKGDIHAESFLGIQVSLDPKQDLLFHQDLNTTVMMIQRREFFEAVDKECFPDKLDVQEDCRGNYGLQNNWLSNLVTLKLYNCTLKYAIPSVILGHLMNLKELEVRDSNKLEIIFDVKETETLKTASQLQKLTLTKLSQLTHLWKMNSQEIIMFQNLQQVSVSFCENLKTLFPASLAKNLEELENLDIRNCEKLEEIVEKEHGIAANVTQKFAFPRLEGLFLRDLPQLTNFYPQTFTLEFPALTKLHVRNCHKLEIFQSADTMGDGEGSANSINRQPLISNQKVICNLKDLELGWKHILALSLSFESEKFKEGLQNLTQILLIIDTIEDEKPVLPIDILQKAPNLIHLTVLSCESPRTFFAENPKIGEDKMLGQLRRLTLDKVSVLQSLETEDSSWLKTICEKLHELYMFRCPDLTTLLHSTSTVSFSCLKKVSLFQCPKLQYLFTSSVARELRRLKVITVEACESVREIVIKEGDATSETVKFERLNTIILDSLSSLICFSSSCGTLQLPSLKKVLIWHCPKMKIFSQGVVHAECFQGIQIARYQNQDLLFNKDVNTTVKVFFQRQESFEDLDDNCFTENLEIQATLYGKVGPQNRWLSNLVTLKLYNCILPYAIPSVILGHLMNLKELEVRDSNKLEIIFDVKETETLKTASQLQKLTLTRLSQLTHLWEMNSQGTIMFQNLQQVSVSFCENLKTLFPASLAKNLEELENLDIRNCEKLQDIVEKEHGIAANVTQKFAFPRLEGLFLRDLPQLTNFYPQTFTLECPALTKLRVLNCHKLELFQSRQTMGDGEGSTNSINRQPLISNQKVICNLKYLELDWKHVLALNLSFESEQFTEGLQDLTNIHMLIDTIEDEKPVFPIDIFQKAPNLIHLTVLSCESPRTFFAENPKIGEDKMLGQLRRLKLDKVSVLQSLETEDTSWLKTICEKLHELYIFRCPDLTTLLHSTSTVSFSCLKKVSLFQCPKLQYLFTSSVARELTRLEVIIVEACESVRNSD